MLRLVEQSRDAAVKITMAVRKTGRVPKRATIQPLSGISMARVIR